MVQDGNDSRYSPAPTASWNDIGAELVIFQQESGAYHALNSSGSAVWRALAITGTVEAATEFLASRFAVGRDEIASDVRAFVDRALERGLLVVSP